MSTLDVMQRVGGMWCATVQIAPLPTRVDGRTAVKTGVSS